MLVQKDIHVTLLIFDHIKEMLTSINVAYEWMWVSEYEGNKF